MEKVWFAEHKIRALTAGRGMRPGKAIRRAIGTTDEETQALAGLWVDGEFAVTFGDSPDLFRSAYAQVRSCMQGKGALCHAAYTPHGVQVAVVHLRGQIVARALFLGDAFFRTYGEKSYALEVFLRLVAGMEQRGDWLDAVADKCVVTERHEYSERLVLRERELKTAAPAEGFDPRNWRFNGLEPVRDPSYPDTVFLYLPEMVGYIKRSYRAVTFAPYIDRG